MKAKEMQLGAYIRKALPLQAAWASPDMAENKWMLTGKGADPFDAFLIKANNPERVVLYTASSEITDYDDEQMTISKKAPRLKNYNRHRACLWAHTYYEPVIANAIRTRKDLEKKQLLLWLEFLPRDVYEEADKYFKIIRHQQSDGTSAMPNGSIGFKYYEGKHGTMEDEGYIFKYTDWELLEFSPCPVGSNPEAHAHLPSEGKGKTKFWSGYKPGVWPTKLIINPSDPDFASIAKSLPGLAEGPSVQPENKGRVLDEPEGDWKWYIWMDKSEASAWVEENDYSPISSRKEPNFWHFSLTSKDKYSEFRNQWIGSKVKPAGFDPKKPEGRPVKLNLGKIKNSDKWEKHNLEFYHGEKDLGKTFESAEAKLDALLFYVGEEVIPRLDRLEKGRSGGNEQPKKDSDSPASEASEEKAGASDAEQMKSVHRGVATLFQSGKPKTDATDPHLTATLKAAHKHFPKGDEDE